jgi:superfamily II DNA/RNA helicase
MAPPFYMLLTRSVPCRQRLIEILNSGQYQPPMIVFTNQKKGADMLLKDLQRAHVSPTSVRLLFCI